MFGRKQLRRGKVTLSDEEVLPDGKGNWMAKRVDVTLFRQSIQSEETPRTRFGALRNEAKSPESRNRQTRMSGFVL